MEICVSVLDPSTGNSNCRQPGKVIVAIQRLAVPEGFGLGLPHQHGEFVLADNLLGVRWGGPPASARWYVEHAAPARLRQLIESSLAMCVGREQYRLGQISGQELDALQGSVFAATEAILKSASPPGQAAPRRVMRNMVAPFKPGKQAGCLVVVLFMVAAFLSGVLWHSLTL
jgi:hypothetical protein